MHSWKALKVCAPPHPLTAGPGAEHYWLRGVRPSAILAVNDLIAIGILDAMRDARLSVPEDVSLIGHNDMPLVDLVAQPLTTVRSKRPVNPS